VGFFEALAIEGGVDAGGELLLAAPPDEARHEAAAGDHVDHGQLFGETHRIVGEGQRIAEEHHFTRLVMAARIEAKTLHLACMQNGALLMLVQA